VQRAIRLLTPYFVAAENGLGKVTVVPYRASVIRQLQEG
jgi:hypothetical protein